MIRKISWLLGVIIIVATSFSGCKSSTSGKEPGIKTDSLPADIQLATKKIEADPQNPELYVNRAKLFIDKKMGAQGLEDINRAIKLKPNIAGYYILQSDAYLQTGKIRECKAALEKAVSLDNQSTEAYLKLAELSLFYKDYVQVKSYLEKVLEIDPNNAKAFFINGFSMKEKGDTAKAVVYFQKAVDADQTYYDAYIQLGMLFSIKKSRLAEDYIQSALKLRPKSTEALYFLGLYYQQTEDFNKAMDTYNQILKVDPKYKYAHFNLGYIHMFYLHIYDVAVRHFANAIQADPNYAEAYYNRGYCYELLGDVANARTDYEQAMRLRPNYSLAVTGLQRLSRADALMKKQ